MSPEIVHNARTVKNTIFPWYDGKRESARRDERLTCAMTSDIE